MCSAQKVLFPILLLVCLSNVASAFTPFNYHQLTRSNHGKSSTLLRMKLPPSSTSSSKKSWRKLNKLSNNRSVESAMKSTLSPNLSSSSSPVHRAKNLLQTLVHKLTNLDEVSKWRVAAATFITSIIAFAPSIDMQLIKLWSWLQNDTVSLLPRLFRHDHWEWMVAVWAFFFWIHGYWLVDRSIAKADARGITHRWKKYRLQDQFEAEKFRRMQVKRLKQSDEDVSIANEMKPATTKQHKWHLGFWVFELPLYCLPLYIIDKMIPRRGPKIAAWGAPTAFQICSDVTKSLMVYDLGFFVCHFLMHKIPFLYKYVHAKHHTSTEVRASDIVRLSGVEEVVDVGISILTLNCLKAHPVSRTIYNVIITFLLTELHSGYAFPWTPQFVVPFGLATGSKGHHYHHRNGKHYYQKFFCHVDKLFGFVQKKDSSLQGFSV